MSTSAVRGIRSRKVAGNIAGLRGILPPDGLRGAWILAVWAAWAVLFYIPVIAPYALSARWGTAVLVGGSGWLLLIQQQQPFVRRLLPAAFGLLAMAVVSISYSIMTDYTALRVANFGLLMGGSVALCAATVRSPDGMRRAFFLMLLPSVVGTLVIAVSGVTAEIDLSNAGSRFQGANELRATGAAGIIAATMPLLMWCYRYSKPGWKSIWVIFALYLTVLILATKARSGIGMAIVTWPMTWTLLRRRDMSMGWILLICIGLAAGLVLQSSESLRHSFRLEGREDVSTGRFERWQLCFEKWKENPLQGYGFGTSRYHHLDASEANWTVQTNRFNQSVTHNEHISVMYELGALGLIMYWGVIYCVVRAGFQAVRMPLGVYRDLVVVVFMSWGAQAMNTMAHDANLSAGHPGAYMYWMKAAFVCCGVQVLMFMQRNAILAKRRAAEAAGVPPANRRPAPVRRYQ